MSTYLRTIIFLRSTFYHPLHTIRSVWAFLLPMTKLYSWAHLIYLEISYASYSIVKFSSTGTSHQPASLCNNIMCGFGTSVSYYHIIYFRVRVLLVNSIYAKFSRCLSLHLVLIKLSLSSFVSNKNLKNSSNNNNCRL